MSQPTTPSPEPGPEHDDPARAEAAHAEAARAEGGEHGASAQPRRGKSALVQRKDRLFARATNASLGQAVAGAMLALVFLAWVVLWATNLISNGKQGWNPFQLNTEHMSWSDRLKYAAAVATGAGAVVALVVNYRKQRDAERKMRDDEEGRFSGLFAEAAAQLGHDAPAVRIAGVYALAALADKYAEYRQQCIDALCGYLRLPYDPDAGSNHTTTRTLETPTNEGGKRTITDAYRAADREVRLTIIRTIRNHLQDPTQPTTWCGHDLDFTGAVFDGGDFIGSVFSGGRVSFNEAMFASGRVSFSLARFSDGRVSFTGARFSGGEVSFDGATFSGGTVSFDLARFSDGRVSFDGATFSGGEVSFGMATFSGGEVSFYGARFSGGTVSFGLATFSGGGVSLDQVTFSGGLVVRDGRDFRGWPESAAVGT